MQGPSMLLTKKTRRTAAILALGTGVAVAGAVACKARKFNSDAASAQIINRPTDFNDDLPKDFDTWEWNRKADYLWSRNTGSPRHVIEDPSPKSEAPVLGTPETFPNLKKGIAFIRDTLDFRGRSVESIAGLTVYSRLRDVYPKDVVEDNGKRSKHKRATHPVGTLGWIEFVPAKDTPYTGMFKTGAQGLARLSTATNPYITDVMNRSLAIKFPVTGSYSRSLFAMNRVVSQKIGPGQEIKTALKGDPALREAIDYRYFKEGKHLTNILPPPQGFEKNITQKFSDVVKYILTTTGRLKAGEEDKWDFLDMASRLSLENMAWHNQDGSDAIPVAAGQTIAPRRVTLIPEPSLYAAGPETKKMDFRDELSRLPVGTTLWTVYGLDSIDNPPVDIDAPKPLDMSKIGRPIGTIVLRKPFYASVFANEEIMFKHFVADIQTKDDLDRTFAVVGEDRLEKPEDSVLDTLPPSFLVDAPVTPPYCGPKTKFEDNPRKKRVFDPYLGEFDFVTSDIAPYCMARFNPAKGFPEELQGVWWMNGNTVAETLVSFGKAEWDDSKKRLRLDPTAPYTWAWYASVATRDRESTALSKKTTEELAGMKGFQGVRNQALEFTFDPAEKREVIRIDGFIGKLLMPRSVFDMTFLENRKEDDPVELLGVDVVENDPGTVGKDVLFRRTRIMSGFVQGDYRFTRIVDGQGKPVVENYRTYLETMKRFNLVYTGIRNEAPAAEKKKRWPWSR